MTEKKLLITSIAASTLTTAVILIIGVAFLLRNQTEIFGRLANIYSPSDESLTIAAVEKVSPAVIAIVITKDVPIIEQYYENINFPDFFGNGFFNFSMPVPQYRQNGTEKKDVGSGSGFLISADGLAITNKHVVDDTAASYTAFTNNGKKHAVTVVAKDTKLDIAIVRVKDIQNSPYLSFGDSDKVKIGQSVIAIGNALGEFRNTVSVGVISGLSRSITANTQTGKTEKLDKVLQTDAAINPGNSGGPLLDLNGQVIGVNVAVVQGSENIGFSVPANAIKNFVDTTVNKQLPKN